MATKSIFAEPISRNALISILRYINAQDISNVNWGFTYLYPGTDLKKNFGLDEDAEIVEGEYLYIYFDEEDGALVMAATWDPIPCLTGACKLLVPSSVMLVRIS